MPSTPPSVDRDVRDVDDPGIELTGLHLGEQCPHVGLVGVDRGRDPGVVQCLAAEVTAGDVLGTQPDQEVLIGEILQTDNVPRIAGWRRDLEQVPDEDLRIP